MHGKPKEKARPKESGAREAGDLRFETRNYAALAGALISIALGFLLLSRGSITAAPILLVLGYCVLVPYGLTAGRGGGRGALGE